jgi:hypothetical protein
MAVAASDGALPSNQGLTLVPVSAQREPFFVTETSKAPHHMGQQGAHVELKSGRV